MEKTQFEISGIKCDNPECNYRDDSVKFYEYPAWIGKPCPKCNWNLLTTEDYRACIKMQKRVEIAFKVGKVLRFINPMFYFRLITGRQPKLYEATFEYRNKNQPTDELSR